MHKLVTALVLVVLGSATIAEAQTAKHATSLGLIGAGIALVITGDDESSFTQSTFTQSTFMRSNIETECFGNTTRGCLTVHVAGREPSFFIPAAAVIVEEGIVAYGALLSDAREFVPSMHTPAMHTPARHTFTSNRGRRG